MALSWMKDPIEKIKSRSWKQNLGTAMRVTAKIAEVAMPPGAGSIVGGALSIGAKLLDPQDDNDEIATDIAEVKRELQAGFKEIEKEMGKVESGIADLKCQMTKNLEQTVALRFKDPLGKIESTYERMVKMGKIKMDVATKHLKDNFEKLAIKADQYLKPETIREYLEAIPGDNEMRRKVMQYVILVSGKTVIVSMLWPVPLCSCGCFH